MDADAAAGLQARPPSTKQPVSASKRGRSLRANTLVRTHSARIVKLGETNPAVDVVPKRARSQTARMREFGISPLPRTAIRMQPHSSKKSVVQPTRGMKLDLKLGTKAARDELFRLMDIDGSGTLTYMEIEAGMRKEYLALDTLIKAKRRGNQILKRAHEAAEVSIGKDKPGHGDGVVTRAEFRLFVEYVEFFANLWDAFELVDVDDDGQLNLSEFQEGFLIIEPQSELTSDELELEFQHVDKDRTGLITFQEFCSWMGHRRRHDAPQVHARQQKTTQGLELVLSCSGLEAIKGVDVGSLDTQAVVSEVKRAPNRGRRQPKDRDGVCTSWAKEFTYDPLGHTEVVKRCRSPSWTQFVDVDMKEADNPLYQQQIRIQLFLVNAKGQHIRELGFVKFGLEDLYKARWRRMTFSLQSRAETLSSRSPSSARGKRPRISVCAVERAPSRQKKWVRMQFQATDLHEVAPAATDGSAVLSSAARRPTTYLQVSRQLQGFLQPFYRSEIAEKTCNPCWRDHGVSFQHFCAGDDDCLLLIEIYKVDEITLTSGATINIYEQRDELRLGQVQLSAKKIFEAGRAHKEGNADGSMFAIEAAQLLSSRHTPSLTVLQFLTYYPEKGTQRRELHLEDKHFAADREFLSDLLGAQAVDGDVAEKVDEAQRYVEQCAQAWITRRKEDEEQEQTAMRSSRKAKRKKKTACYDLNGRAVGKPVVATDKALVGTVDSLVYDGEGSLNDSAGDDCGEDGKQPEPVRTDSGGDKSGVLHSARRKMRQTSKIVIKVEHKGGPRGKRVNLWLPSNVTFAKGSKAERMAIFGLREHQKRLKATRTKKPDKFKVDPKISAVLDKAGSHTWWKPPVSESHAPTAKVKDSSQREDSPGEHDKHIRVSGHLINAESDHEAHYEEQLGCLDDGTKLLSSTIEHLRLKSPRWAHTNVKLHSKNRLADEWKATTATLRINGDGSPRSKKVQIDTPNRKPLYVNPGTKGKGANDAGNNPYAAVKTPRRGGRKKKNCSTLGAPKCAMTPTRQAEPPPAQKSGRNRRTTGVDGSLRFSQPPADPAAPYGGRSDLRFAQKVRAAKAERAEITRKQDEAKKRKADGTQQLTAWLREIGQRHLLSTFQSEGFNSLADVRNADLGQEDLAVLGITELDKQQMALETLAANCVELGQACAKQISMGLAKLDRKSGRSSTRTLHEAVAGANVAAIQSKSTASHS